ncbi:MAG: pyrimidine 5'-nucleotidase [Alphaproteobacteria bacterium]|nr:pyrimidine 5'-nucleotidase [Alphaproteobacteria bacterium]
MSNSLSVVEPKSLAHVRHWVFDLDNTLHPADATLWDAVGARMTDYVARLTGLPHAEAEALQERYLLDYGATVVGLVQHHDADATDFMDYVHDVPMLELDANPGLRAAIGSLPGKSYVFTNGGKDYAARLLRRLDLLDLFDAVFDLQTAGFAAKPHDRAFTRFLEMTGVDAARAAMFEDTPRNLEAAARFGFSTVLVRHAEGGDHRVSPRLPYVDFETWDLEAFLRGAA